jgi:DTW domain-containing protein YfiP
LCLCDAIPRLATATTIALVAHHTEWSRSSNTGRLLLRALPSTRLWLRGEHGRPEGAQPEPLAGRRLVLFPEPNARTLCRGDAGAAGAAGDELVLVVPEGSWGQARRAVRREPWMRDAERVCLPSGPPSRYRLRTAPHEEGLSTIEAVARALGVLEGEAIERALLATFEAFVERSLAVRGRRAATRVDPDRPAGQ